MEVVIVVLIAIAVFLASIVGYAMWSSAKTARQRAEREIARYGTATSTRVDVVGSGEPAARFETKTVTLSKYSFSKGLTDVPRELEKYVADGWEIVSEDLKKYGRGGKHSILLRRPV